MSSSNSGRGRSNAYPNTRTRIQRSAGVPPTWTGLRPGLPWHWLVAAIVVAGLSWVSAAAQTQGLWGTQLESISGVVTDPSGAVVPGAAVVLMSAGDPPQEVSRTTSGPGGGYRLRTGPGKFTLVVIAKGFAQFESDPLEVGAIPEHTMAPAAQGRTLDVSLKLEMKVERIEVPDDISRSEDSTGNALVLSSEEVHEMPMDSTALLEELRGLTGGDAATLYVDGFSATKLPPRDNIRQIRINQNPYSAENDTDPVDGLIQVSSKPGTNQVHGEGYLYGNDSALNAGNPFAPDEPPYYSFGTGGALSGPLSGRSSYYARVEQLSQQVNAAVNAQTLDPTMNQTQVPNPRTSLDVAPRVDVQPAANSTMIFRYIFDRTTLTNGGVGQLALPSQGFNNTALSHTVRLTNTQLIGMKIVNETRFQYVRSQMAQTPVSTDPAILVQGEFLGGGNNLGSFNDYQDHYELQNYVSMANGRHYLDFGGRLRVGRDSNHSEADFNGEYIFSTLSAYQLTLKGTPAASQYHRTVGSPDAVVSLADAGVFAQDDWKVRENLTFSYGLRFETQTGIADHADWAPRVGFSLGLGGRKAANGGKAAATYVLHGGAGVFYQRFELNPMLQVARQNGVTLQQFVITSPQFCPAATNQTKNLTIYCPGAPSDGADLSAHAASPSVYRMDPNFHSPYFVGGTLTLERQLGRHGTMSVTYLHNRGVHTQLTENVNAPIPGSYDPSNPQSGVRPEGGNQNVYEYRSRGVNRSNRFATNISLRTSRFQAHASYTLRFDRSDANNDGTFPTNPYNLGVDYGRSLSDVRHTGTLGESVKLPYGIQSWGYLQATSGAPFNIVVGQDLNGDTQYNDRPAFATDLGRSSVVQTPWGAFDASPIAGQTIVPRNYGQGPGLFALNLAVGKSLGIGRKLDAATPTKGPAQKKYTVELWVEMQNLLNHPNYAPPVGIVNSSLFGHSTGLVGGSSLSPDRSFDLQLSTHF